MVACAVDCLCALADDVSMACPWFAWGRNGSGGSPQPPKQRKPDESNALCSGVHCGIWTPLHDNKQDLSIAFRADPSKSISTFRGASSVPSPCFFGWDICSSLSSSFGVLTACSADSLTQASLPSLTQASLSSLGQGVDESFSLSQGS